MNETQALIIEMLNMGMSYSAIQEELNVSSKTIAAARKVHFPTREITTDALSGNTFQKNPDPPPQSASQNTTFEDTNRSNNNQTPKSNTPMTDYNEDYNEDDNEGPITKLGLEKFKLQLEHERELARIEASSEKDEREIRLRENELQYKRDELDAIQQRKSDEKRTLLFRTKELAEQCIDDKYSHEEIETLLDDAEEVLSESERYCFINQITYAGTESHTILSRMIETLSKLLESTDEDESGDLEFENSLRRLISRTTFQTF